MGPDSAALVSVGWRIAQQPLQRGAGEAERTADENRKDGAWQAYLADDDLRRLGATPEEAVGNIDR